MTGPTTAAPMCPVWDRPAVSPCGAFSGIANRVFANNANGPQSGRDTAKDQGSRFCERDHGGPGRRPRRRHRRRAQDHDHRKRRRAAERPVRICAPLAADGIAGVGGSADRPSARLCRAALHLCRSRTGRRCPLAAFDLDQLSGPDPRRQGRRGLRGALVRLVRLLPLGGSTVRSSRHAGEDIGVPASGVVENSSHCRPAARTLAARRHYLWPRRPRMERGTGAAAL